MSRFWADAGWIAAGAWAAAWWLAHSNAQYYEKLYRDAGAGWDRALDGWRASLDKWAEADRRERIRRERAP